MNEQHTPRVNLNTHHAMVRPLVESLLMVMVSHGVRLGDFEDCSDYDGLSMRLYYGEITFGISSTSEGTIDIILWDERADLTELIVLSLRPLEESVHKLRVPEQAAYEDQDLPVVRLIGWIKTFMGGDAKSHNRKCTFYPDLQQALRILGHISSNLAEYKQTYLS